MKRPVLSLVIGAAVLLLFPLAAYGDILADLAGKTLYIKGTGNCKSSPRATREITQTNVEGPIYISKDREIFLFFGTSRDSGVRSIPDGKWRRITLTWNYDDAARKIPVRVRSSVLNANSFKLGWDWDYKGLWPSGSQLRHKYTTDGTVIVTDDRKRCRVVDSNTVWLLTDGEEVLEDYTCVSTVNCRIAEGRPQ